MFQVSRGGLGTNLGLFLLRISSSQSHSVAAAPPLSTGGKAAQKRLERATSNWPGKVPRLGSEAEEPSLKAKEEAKLKASLGRCFSLLEAIGRESPRWDRTFGGSSSTSTSWTLQRNSFLAKFQGNRGLDAARRHFEAYIRSMKGIKMDPYKPDEWHVAAFVADQCNRSSTGPARMLRSLVWAASAFDLNLCLDSPLVQAQKSTWTSSDQVRDRQPARMATAEMLTTMEEVVCSDGPSFWRAWAGIYAALGHGCLRWADLQKSKDLILTEDSVFARSWRMKGKSGSTPWAALRVGLSSKDWGAAWVKALAEHGLPREDYIMYAPDASWKGFRRKPADFYDAQTAMRAILMDNGMPQSEAMTFSCHSWRHLYPTAGRQLDLDPEQLDSIGHWAPSSGMAALYDSRACVSELIQKAKVRKALTTGWRMASPGCIPGEVPDPISFICNHPPSTTCKA